MKATRNKIDGDERVAGETVAANVARQRMSTKRNEWYDTADSHSWKERERKSSQRKWLVVWGV